MNEFLEIALRDKDAAPLAITRQVPGGIELDENDAIERAIGTAAFTIGFDDRTCVTNLAACSDDVARLLETSTLDEEPALFWLENPDWRPCRKACLLNVVAALSVTPTKTAPFIVRLQNVFRVFNDRCYMKVDRGLLTMLETLAADPSRPIYAEGEPHAPIHGRLLDSLPEPLEVRTQFTQLLSFRAEGAPSLQTVIAVPPPTFAHTYAEFDLDLGNPLQDVLGFVVHMGELSMANRPTISI